MFIYSDINIVSRQSERALYVDYFINDYLKYSVADVVFVRGAVISNYTIWLSTFLVFSMINFSITNDFS